MHTEYEAEKIADEPESMNINEQEDVMTSSVENVQEEDVLVEENVTPFFMNSGIHSIISQSSISHVFFSLGENFQQTLHRLGIEIPPNILKEHQL